MNYRCGPDICYTSAAICCRRIQNVQRNFQSVQFVKYTYTMREVSQVLAESALPPPLEGVISGQDELHTGFIIHMKRSDTCSRFPVITYQRNLSAVQIKSRKQPFAVSGLIANQIISFIFALTIYDKFDDNAMVTVRIILRQL